MGYTHYYYVLPEYDTKRFNVIVKDFKKMLPVMKHLGLKLGNGAGRGNPVANKERIWFNGLEKCGHNTTGVGLAWPSDNAKGLATTPKRLQDIVEGHWCAGPEINTRVCNGDCSYETFHFSRIHEKDYKGQLPDDTNTGKYFQFTKTNYQPYDIAVTVCLIIMKHYLGRDIVIRSDGKPKDWVDGMRLTQQFLGYGENFQLDVREPVEPKSHEVSPHV